MRKILVSATLAASFISIGCAQASDLPNKKTTPVAPAITAYNWNGAYVGVHAGYSFGSAKQFDKDARDTVNDFNTTFGTNLVANFSSMDNFQGGIYGGYNIQNGNIVTGIEADINFGEIKRATTGTISGGGASLTLSGYLKEEMSGTAKIRIGYAFDNVLPFITGGLERNPS